MNILINELPTRVDIDGVSTPIKCGFRTALKFSELSEADMTAEERVYKTLETFYYKEIPKNHIESAVKQALSFYSRGKYNPNSSNSSHKNAARTFSFTYDADYIYSAFLQVYGIDLQADNMHWWRFLALLGGLPDDCKFTQIVSIRATDTSKMSKSMKQHYDELKRVYALPLSDRQAAMQAEIEQALLNGGDIQAVMARYKE